jgi:hypothetical protein
MSGGHNEPMSQQASLWQLTTPHAHFSVFSRAMQQHQANAQLLDKEWGVTDEMTFVYYDSNKATPNV